MLLFTENELSLGVACSKWNEHDLSRRHWRSREDFEPLTPSLGNSCSIQLSYGTAGGDITASG